MSKSKHPASSGDAMQLEKLIHDLEFENRLYVKEIEKEKQRLTAAEKKLTEHKTEADDIQKEIHKLDETTKNYHKQFTHNRDNIESLRKTIQVLADHEEALQKDFENFNEKGLREREEWTQSLNHYRGIWQDYKTVYEENELAKKLKKERNVVKEKENTLNSLRVRSEDVKGKIDRLQTEQGEEFIPYYNLNAFVMKVAEMKLQNDKGEKAVLSIQKEKSDFTHQLQVLQKRIEVKRQEEEERRLEEERRKSEEQEESRRREEEENCQRKLEEEKKRKLDEARKLAAEKETEKSLEFQRQAQSIQRANRSAPTITIPTFNYANYRKSTLMSSDGIANNTENTQLKMSDGKIDLHDHLKKQPAPFECPPLPRSPPFSVAAMATSSLPLLRKVQESQLQKKALDIEMPENSDGGDLVISTLQNRSQTVSIPGSGTGNCDSAREYSVQEMTENIPISSETANTYLDHKSPGHVQEKLQIVSCPKSPFDIQKHRERVKRIQKSPEGFGFTKRDMLPYTTEAKSQPQADNSFFVCPPNPEARPKQLSPTTKSSTSNSPMQSDGSGDGTCNKYEGMGEMSAMVMFGGSKNVENSAERPQFGSGCDISDGGGNAFSLFGGGNENDDSSDAQDFNFNFGSVENEKSSPGGIFSMF